MNLVWSLHPDTHVRALAVVELDDPLQFGAAFFACGDDALYKVRVLPVVVLRVRCPVVLAPPHAYHQVVLPEQFDERVAAGHPAAVAQAIRYHPVQLRASYARIVPAQFACGLDDDTLDGIVGEVMVAALVERLPAITKQPAEGIQGRAREPAA